MNRLQEIYDSEINFSISTFFDAGFEVKLGDETNGFKSHLFEDTFEEAVEALSDSVIEHYPDSDFAVKYKDFKK